MGLCGFYTVNTNVCEEDKALGTTEDVTLAST